MPAPTKRSRTDPTPSPEEMIDAPPTPTPTPTPSSSGASSQRRFTMTLITPTRPTLTRSATTELNTPAHLTRSSSLVVPTRLGLGGIRGGTLFRTQSLSSVPSPAQVKAGLPPGGSGVEGKGEGLGFDGEGAKRWGKGKENIPPRKDEENGAQRSEDGSRKRLRVGRTRSGSVVSMRSEGGGESASR